VTSQALKYDVITYTPYEGLKSKLHYFRQNYTTWNSNRLLQGRPWSSASLGLVQFILSE